MGEKKQDTRKRKRVLIEFPEDGKKVWMHARQLALGRCTIGEYMIEALKEKNAREEKNR